MHIQDTARRRVSSEMLRDAHVRELDQAAGWSLDYMTARDGAVNRGRSNDRIHQ